MSGLPRITEFLSVAIAKDGTEYRYFLSESGRPYYRYKTKSGWSVDYPTSPAHDDDCAAMLLNLKNTLEEFAGKPAWQAMRDGNKDAQAVRS